MSELYYVLFMRFCCLALCVAHGMIIVHEFSCGDTLCVGRIMNILHNMSDADAAQQSVS